MSVAEAVRAVTKQITTHVRYIPSIEVFLNRVHLGT